jgi:hypothetical protein
MSAIRSAATRGPRRQSAPRRSRCHHPAKRPSRAPRANCRFSGRTLLAIRRLAASPPPPPRFQKDPDSVWHGVAPPRRTRRLLRASRANKLGPFRAADSVPSHRHRPRSRAIRDQVRNAIDDLRRRNLVIRRYRTRGLQCEAASEDCLAGSRSIRLPAILPASAYCAARPADRTGKSRRPHRLVRDGIAPQRDRLLSGIFRFVLFQPMSAAIFTMKRTSN